MRQRSMYTDAQWLWLHDRFTEGHSVKGLADFAGCSIPNIMHHWRRLGRLARKYERKPLSKKEFNALGWDGE